MARDSLLPQLALVALVAVGLAACPATRAGDQGLGVRIRFSPTSRSTCARLMVRWAEGTRSGPLLHRGDPKKQTLTIAVLRLPGMPAEVQVFAQGFSGEGCDTPGAPLESSAEQTAAFDSAARELTEVVLEGKGCATPGDCADPACETTACAGGGTCQGGYCLGAATELACADGIDNDDDQKLDCADPDCLGLFCAPADRCLSGARCDLSSVCAGGTPRVCPAPGPCQADAGVCNPLDGGCEFPPATGAPCASGDACRQDEQCDPSGACGGGSARVCFQTSSSCRADAGTCDPVQGCQYAELTSACSTGDACRVGESCGAGVCGGGAPLCSGPPPGECLAAQGDCDAGVCSYAVLNAGQPCDGGTCTGAGVCLRQFLYVPSNFVPALTSPGPALFIDCAVTIDTDPGAGNHFPGWCAGALTPAFSFLSVNDPTARQPMLIAVQGLTVGDAGSITVRGSQPILFAVYGDATVKGIISADAVGGTPGPGAGTCAADGGGVAGGGNPTSYVGGGGGGAGLGTGGAAGDNGNGGVYGDGVGGAGGTASPAAGFIPLRAGCRGGAGWNFGGTSTPGAGGGGVQLSVAGTLSITGRISAGGGGGGPADSTRHGAGSGGGSGGVVLLEGDVLSLGGAKVTANGGAGGGGKSELTGGAREADAGANADPQSAVPAVGGTPGTTSGSAFPGTGGRGGNGGAGAAPPGAGGGATFYGGGGGGGGAFGRVHLKANRGCTTAGALFSPAPSRSGAFTCP
ncbi:MAG: hypothetical protein ACYC8T_38870 [Myxococcaceae bacterium]